MQEKTVEIAVGLLIIVGVVALLMLAIKVSGLSPHLKKPGYHVTASFETIGNLKRRSAVTIAGVKVGEVSNIKLDPKTYMADVTMAINPDINDIPTDTSASILTAGLLGANYISLTPGFDDTYLTNNSTIEQTNPALILENLIGQLVYSLTNDKKDE